MGKDNTNTVQQGKFSFLVFRQELKCVITYTILGLILSLIHLLGIRGFEIKFLPLFIVFWAIIGVVLYIIAYGAFGKNTEESSEFFTKRLTPYYIPMVDVDVSYYRLVYPNTSNNAVVKDSFKSFFDDYWKESARTKTKTKMSRLTIFYILFFGGLILLGIAVIVLCFLDATTIKEAINSYNNSPQNVDSLYYSIIKTEGENLEMILAFNNVTTITGLDFSTCAYLIGFFSYMVSILSCIFFHRMKTLFAFSCTKCGNVGLFSKRIKSSYEGEHYIHSTEENEEQIGTIRQKGLCGTTKDVADVYVTRKDHYKNKVSSSHYEYSCTCPFCGQKKEITVFGRYVHSTEYDHSSY